MNLYDDSEINRIFLDNFLNKQINKKNSVIKKTLIFCELRGIQVRQDTRKAKVKTRTLI